ncbi:KGK domain-containing protein [Limnoraphis robusta Tam1]|uniref:KGK domain-containing protein n=1 Tax=Limnoraphis robusta TaxID=1118279 RepID=UPI002B21F823|nr:KGK domain-containing protein [Limnoraphis robusta]MEA5497528.1 KGK domain-containing protein [Limnoraphis robusta BA-68 BA1]MEA5539855.1 KGK domain-containing protein [Limnoraphis robusta Tam1]
MEDNVISQNCNDDDVLLFEDEAHKVSTFQYKVFRVLINRIYNTFVDGLIAEGVTEAKIEHSDDFKYPNAEWFNNGKECEILKLGSKGWQKGKVRLKIIVEFCPDEPEVSEPESPLDSLRQKLMESETEHN